MLRRRILLENCKNNKLLFYAPFSHNKTPVYAWDDNYELLYEGSSTITYGYLYIRSTSPSYRMIFSCKAPIEKDMTISAMHYFQYYNDNWSFSLAASLANPDNNSLYPFLYSNRDAHNRVQMHGEDLKAITSTNIPRNTWKLVSISIKKEANPHEYTCIVYWDGVEQARNTGIVDKYTNYKSLHGQPYVAIGVNAGYNVFTGRLKNYTVHELLTTEEIVELYNRTGVPTGY